MNIRFLLIAWWIFLFSLQLEGQKPDAEIAQMIQQFKSDARGPYKDIRWFCPDGSFVAPRDTCKEEGGFQRARYKDEVVKLGETNHIYLGQILSGTEKDDFYDGERDYSRMKQYIVEHFLQDSNDGWILQKAKFYRGAIQAEDEETWGKEFLLWALDNLRFDRERYFLMRELVKTIPHSEQTNLVQTIRALSKSITDRNISFMDLRTKIHGNPESKDLQAVKDFRATKTGKWSQQDIKDLEQLIGAMDRYYNTTLTQKISPVLKSLPTGKIKSEINDYLEVIKHAEGEERLIRVSDLLTEIKTEILGKNTAKLRLSLYDISILLEQDALQSYAEWNPATLGQQLISACYLGQLTCATGYLYDWEYEELLSEYPVLPEKEVDINLVNTYLKAVKKNINWGSMMINTEFGNVVKAFTAFEPLAASFFDDRIRSSSLLYLGQTASDLTQLMAEKAGWENNVFNRKSATIQGINPGYAKGKLVVVDQLEEENIDPKAIYVFRKSPSDLEPVAGILSISEGNLVSHLQLLARNLGIPNANISEADFRTLGDHQGEEIFFAVSNRGGIIIKLAEKMTEEERALFSQATVDDEVLAVPTDQLELANPRIYSISELDASSSGKICGPKAANFARLKKLFPDNLVNGMVIPFSIFRDHMEQTIPDRDISYWEFLKETFLEVTGSRDRGVSEPEIEHYTLGRLEELRNLIKTMPLKPSFEEELKSSFLSDLGQPLGSIPVFLRSDTNMEDLKDFTGAGLNLTVFNTVTEEKILQGIRDVWASPYSERSYKWRQKFLTNPEDVYPSILIIPSVFVDYSGVVITRDFIEGRENRLNAAFSQGAGGAVDGQQAESWIMDPSGTNILVAPARDRSYKYLTRSGGTANNTSSLSHRIVSASNFRDIWNMCEVIYREMPKVGMPYPYDIELGFEKDKLWIFQIRPFVENKKAVSSFYLGRLDPVIPENININLNENISFNQN